jgi:hypothetical protein
VLERNHDSLKKAHDELHCRVHSFEEPEPDMGHVAAVCSEFELAAKVRANLGQRDLSRAFPMHGKRRFALRFCDAWPMSHYL